MRHWITKGVPVILLLTFFLSLATCGQMRQNLPEEVSATETEIDHSLYQYGVCIDSLFVTDYQINKGDNLSSIFMRLGFSALQAEKIIQAAKEVLDPTRLRQGMLYTTFQTQDIQPAIQYMAFAKSQTDYAVIDLTGDSVTAYEFSKPITLKRHFTEGVLHSSLWNTLKKNGTDPFLANKLSDVFAWQIDFFDVKEGDYFKVLYDVAYIDDTTALYISAVQGAVFTHKGKDFVAIPFAQDSIPEYFDEEGNSLRKAFLKAPLEFKRISSHFSNARYHPILKRVRAHHGVDYAAPVGTPVKTIGDGVVIAKGYEKGGGNYLKVKHNSVYTTTYMHLSKFHAGIQVGKQVKQGEVIGYVGSTGLSTGPHLDFRVHKNGQPINPLNMEAPPSEPVRPDLTDSFHYVRQAVLFELDSFRMMQQQLFVAQQDKEANESELLID